MEQEKHEGRLKIKPNKDQYLQTIPLFSFRRQFDTIAERLLDDCGSIVDESINNHGLKNFPS